MNANLCSMVLIYYYLVNLSIRVDSTKKWWYKPIPGQISHVPQESNFSTYIPYISMPTYNYPTFYGKSSHPVYIPCILLQLCLFRPGISSIGHLQRHKFSSFPLALCQHYRFRARIHAFRVPSRFSVKMSSFFLCFALIVQCIYFYYFACLELLKAAS